MDRVTEITRDTFGMVFQLRRLRGDGVKPEALHAQLRRAVDQLMDRARDEGFSQADAQDMAYAVVALVDEVALNQAEAVREHWIRNLLQRQYFNENQAGDGFYARLQSVRADPSRSEVLRVYYLCLLFGFQGRYSVRGGELERMDLIDQLTRELGHVRRKVDVEVLSPNALAGTEGLGAGAGSRTLILASLGAVIVAVVLFAGLKLGVSSAASGVTDAIAQGGSVTEAK